MCAHYCSMAEAWRLWTALHTDMQGGLSEIRSGSSVNGCQFSTRKYRRDTLRDSKADVHG